MAGRDEKGRFLKKPKDDQSTKDDQGTTKTAQVEKPVDTGTRAPLESLDQIKDELNQPAQPAPKKKPRGRPKGRPKKAPQPPPEPPPQFDIDIEIMADGIKTLFAMAGDARGPHWPIEDKQALTLARAADAVANKWLPHLGPWLPELTLLGAVAMTVGPRLYIDVKLAKAAQANGPKSQPQPQQGEKPNAAT